MLYTMVLAKLWRSCLRALQDVELYWSWIYISTSILLFISPRGYQFATIYKLDLSIENPSAPDGLESYRCLLLLHKLLIHDHIDPNIPRAAASDGDRYLQYLRPLPTELDGQKKEIYNWEWIFERHLALWFKACTEEWWWWKVNYNFC